MNNHSELLRKLGISEDEADFLIILKHIWRLIDASIMYETPVTITDEGYVLLAQLSEWGYGVSDKGVKDWADEFCETALSKQYVIDTYIDIRDGNRTFDEIVKATKRGNSEDSDLVD